MTDPMKSLNLFAAVVVETLAEADGPVPASSLTLAWESAGFGSNLQAAEYLQLLGRLGVVVYTTYHTVDKGPRFAEVLARIPKQG